MGVSSPLMEARETTAPAQLQIDSGTSHCFDPRDSEATSCITLKWLQVVNNRLDTFEQLLRGPLVVPGSVAQAGAIMSPGTAGSLLQLQAIRPSAGKLFSSILIILSWLFN